MTREQWEEDMRLTCAFGPRARARIVEAAESCLYAYRTWGPGATVAMLGTRAFVDEVWKLLPSEARLGLWVDLCEPPSFSRAASPAVDPVVSYRPGAR